MSAAGDRAGNSQRPFDTHSRREQAIQRALDAFIKGRTTFVVAHRLSTVVKADRIVVIDKGRIVQIGKHHELLATDGVYKRLYETQFAPLAQRADTKTTAG